MTVYIEYVLIDNFVIDYILLKLSVSVIGKKPNKLRLILCAFLGAIIALVFPLIKIEFLVVLIKILTGFLLTAIANKSVSFKEYLSITALFFAFTFAVGGGIFAIFSVFNLDYSKEIFTATIILPVYLICLAIKEIISFLFKRKSINQNLYDVEFTFNNKTIIYSAFLDTGNCVYYKDTPVIFITKEIAKKFFSGIKLPKIVQINVSTVNKSQIKKGFYVEELGVYIKKKRHSIKGIVACVVKKVGTGYDVILHPKIVEGLDEQFDKENRKVS